MDEIRMEDVSPEYAAFVEKFKPKKTTDDCYTPENIFVAVADWACKEYGFARDAIVRPFWPGGDYKRHEYPDGCVVVDNPPFSILSEICRFYEARGIKFFLFAPGLTAASLANIGHVSVLYIDVSITYANGAVVKTAFICNLEPETRLRSVPELGEELNRIDHINQKSILKKRTLPHYEYPLDVITGPAMQKYAHYGVAYRVSRKGSFLVRTLDSQRAAKKSVFGGGYLLSKRERAERERAEQERAQAERAQAERAQAEAAATYVWTLSPDELRVIDELSKEDTNE